MSIIQQRSLIIAMVMPGVLLAFTYLFPGTVHHLMNPLHGALPYIPYFLVIAGLVMSWGYHNGREFNLFILIGLTYWCMRSYIWLPTTSIETQSILFPVLCLLLPLNVVIQSWLPERGVLRWQIAKRFAFTLVQVILVGWWLSYPSGVIQDFLRYALWSNPWPKLLTLTQPGIIMLVIAIALLIAQLVRSRNILTGGVIMSLIAAMMGLNAVGEPTTSMLYFIISSIALVTALVMNSHNLAYLDELTQLPARRALKQQLMSMPKNYCICMLDIDYFKKLNDTFGHHVGDQVLRKIASQLQKIPGMKAYRYGGEEFAVVAHNKTIHETIARMDELREYIGSNPFFIRSKKRPRKKPANPTKSNEVRKFKVTVSIGVAENTDKHATPWDVVKSADKALYAAKRSGRNRVRA